MAEGGIGVPGASTETDINEQGDEVLALESIYDGTECFNVLSSPTDQDEIYAIEVFVRVKVPSNNVRVDAYVPYEHDLQKTQMAVHHLPPNARPNFARTESGQRWHSSFRVTHLSPLCLHATFPASYPSHNPPVFTLACLWLSATQLSCLCQQLDRLWEEYRGMPVVYTWVDWLENNLFEYLALSDHVILTPYNPDLEGCDDCDARALPLCSDLHDDLLEMLKYDMKMENIDFNLATHECMVCFDERKGSEFYRLPECGHNICQDCMLNFCQLHVGEGTVQQLSCPEPSCKTTIPPNIVRDILGDESYERWERLLLQRALDTMGDIEWCPRCNNAVVREDDLGHCNICLYDFCTQCKEAWHKGSNCKGIEEMLASLEQSSKQDGDDKATSDEAEGPSLEQKRKAIYLSLQHMKEVCKWCPKCRAPIIKNGGCSKVHCIKCGTSMCWVCGKRINSYDHFSDTACPMFVYEPVQRRPMPPPRPRAEAAVEIDQALNANPENRRNLLRCAKCGQRNLKKQRNNHIKCWACATHMCFICKDRIQEKVLMSHFGPGKPCVQHSD